MHRSLQILILFVTRYYWAKALLLIPPVLILRELLSVTVVLPIPRQTHKPIWALVFVEWLETYGWALLLAMVLAGIWHMAQRQH